MQILICLPDSLCQCALPQANLEAMLSGMLRANMERINWTACQKWLSFSNSMASAGESLHCFIKFPQERIYISVEALHCRQQYDMTLPIEELCKVAVLDLLGARAMCLYIYVDVWHW